MKLSALAKALNVPAPASDPDIAAVTHHADWAEAGSLFVAIKGASADGHDFIDRAAQNGAVAVMGEGLPFRIDCHLPYLRVPHARQALAQVAALTAGQPSQYLRTVGVTGTDGKTTTSWLSCHLLRASGSATGLLSSVGYQLTDGVDRHFPAHFTTPESPQIQGILEELVRIGADAAVLEVSSHALALNRVDALAWDVAIWTHLTSEHLDFHGSQEGYFEAKRMLIEASPFAVLNADDPWTARLTGIAAAEVSYSATGDPSADWRAENIRQ